MSRFFSKWIVQLLHLHHNYFCCIIAFVRISTSQQCNMQRQRSYTFNFLIKSTSVAAWKEKGKCETKEENQEIRHDNLRLIMDNAMLYKKGVLSRHYYKVISFSFHYILWLHLQLSNYLKQYRDVIIAMTKLLLLQEPNTNVWTIG